MNTNFRYIFTLCLLGTVSIGFAHCTPFGQKPTTIQCGPGYIYNQEASACIPEDSICPVRCDADHKCVNKKCVPRLAPEPRNTLECAVTCGDNETCQNGKCVPAPCDPPCSSGSTCINGVCSPIAECHPPCRQTGYVCSNGLCERICPKNCVDKPGTECIRGTCQKPCKPTCGNGSFCNDGKCVKLEDADKDGFKSDRDCDDNDKDTNPGAVEVCNGKDSDCDGFVDNISPKECYQGPAGTLGQGPCVAGRTVCKDKKQICSGAVEPQAKEICKNNVDDDCNGMVDDGCTTTP